MSRLMRKSTKWHVRPGKTQISQCIRPVWSGSLLSAWRKLGSLATHWVHYEDWFPGWSESLLGPQVILLVLSCCGSNKTCHEVMAIFVLRKLILQTRYAASSGARCLIFWSDPSPTSILHVCEQRRLWRGCANVQACLNHYWSPTW